MRIIKRHPLLKLATDFVIDSPTPSNISYWWNVGSLLGVCLIIQIVTGVTLAMHYNPSVLEAFNSVEHIMRDVNNGWLIRYLHSNTASAFFFLVYLHIGRGLYYGSYKAPRTLTWTLGTVIFIIMMATAFLGYVLPYGQMSLWGATVITNLMSAIPWIGQDIVEFIWGGFSVNNATLNRFFSLHFVLPFVIAALALMHLIALHDTAGSSNPLGVSANYDKVPFAPYFIFKDLITIFIFMWVLSVFVFFLPNVLGDSENYVMANPMQTPPAIVPEWYLLPFYAILRSIPNKLMGVIAMFSAILIILTMSFTDLGKLRGTQFKPFSKVMFFIFVANLLLLMVLGAKHVESPFIEFGQIATLVYFSYFLLFVPTTNLIENSLTDLYLVKGKVDSYAKNNNDVWLEVPHITIAVMLICIYLFIYLYYNLGFTTYYCVDAPNSDTIPTKAEEKILTYTEFLVSKYSNYCLCGLNNDDLVLISDVVQRMAEESLTGDTRFCPGAPTGSDRNQILGKIFSPRGAEFLRHIYSTGDSFEELLRFKGLPVDRSRIFAELLDGFPRFKPGERCYSVIDTKYIELKAHKLGSMGWIVPKGLAAEFMHPTTSTQLPNPGFAYSKPQSSVVPGSIVSQALRPEVIFIGSEYPEAGPSNMLSGHAGSASSAAPQPVAPSASSHSILSQVELRQKGSSQTSFSNTEQMNVDESSNRGLQRKAESSDTSSYDRKGKKRVRCSS